MAQHDYNLANQSGADFRADLNNALSAIATVNSGATAPSTTFAHQLWVDTSSSVLKIRNAANDAWVTTGVSITADNTFTGNITGNAATATALETARTINGASFDGTANISFDTDSVSEGSSNLYFTNARVESYLDAGTSTPTFASAVINTSITGSAILDDDSFGTASATTVATSESIKAYVDSQIGSVDTLAEILLNGNTTGGTDIAFGDNDKAIFGTGSDLQIFHDGSNSNIVDTGTGYLSLRGTDLRLQDSTGWNFVICTDLGQGGEVALLHSNIQKLKTTSTGIDVTGTVTSDGLTVDGEGRIEETGDAARLVVARTDSANAAESASMDLLESTATGGSFGTANNYGFRLDIDGSANTFNIKSGVQTSVTKRFQIGRDTGDISFYDDTGSTQGFFWDASAERLGIGTTSPVSKLTVGDNTTNATAISISTPFATNNYGDLVFTTVGTTTYNARIRATVPGNGTRELSFITAKNASENTVMTLDGDGNVGIGTSSPNAKLTLQNGLQRINSTDGSSDARIQFSMTDGSNVPTAWVGIPSWNKDAFYIFGPTATANESAAFYTNANWVFQTGNTERIRIDSSGNLLVGKTSADFGGTQGVELRPTGNSYFTNTNGNALRLRRNSSDGEILTFRKDATTVGSIEAATNTNTDISIGSDNVRLLFFTNGSAIVPRAASNASADNTIDLGNSGNRFKDLHLSGTGYFGTSVGIGTVSPNNGNLQIGDSDADFNIAVAGARSKFGYDSSNNSAVVQGGITKGIIFCVNNSTFGSGEAGRFDASGNLLVNKTGLDVTNVGHELRSSGYSASTRDGSTVGSYTILNSDGTILEFRKDSAAVGSIGTNGGDIYIGTGDTNLLFTDGSDKIIPANTGGASRDGAIDLGGSSTRFKDIYATNGTIQTSDINEKQDIEELSEAETRVAVAAKGLLKKYRWKSAVADKGDDARIHFGIMAQDLQQAFSAEGLDAGDYGMFISTTWTDETTGEEKTRLGVRYNELLAFIIAAI
jgi:hypothetical protein